MKKLKTLLATGVLAVVLTATPAFADTDFGPCYAPSVDSSGNWITAVVAGAVAVSLWLTDGGWLLALL